MFKTDTIKLGSVKFGSKIVVSDPCYTPGTWCALDVEVKPGKWNATAEVYDAGDWGERISSLRIEHENYHREDLSEELGDGAGVDSGQCGFWDMKKYNAAYKNEKNREKFYDDVCEITLAEKNAGVYENWGVVSSSGYGDGGYPVYAARNKNGEIVALEIVYIDEEDEEDDEYEDMEEA